MAPSSFRPTVIGIVGVALACAFFLPAMRVSVMTFMGGGTVEFSLIDTIKALHEDGLTWVPIVAGLGALIAVGGALSYDDGDPSAMKAPITVGTLLTLILPGRILLLFNDASSEAAEGGTAFSGSLGLGLILCSVGLIIATSIAWYAAAHEGQPHPTTSGSTNYTTLRTTVRPSWMTQDKPEGVRHGAPNDPWSLGQKPIDNGDSRRD